MTRLTTRLGVALGVAYLAYRAGRALGLAWQRSDPRGPLATSGPIAGTAGR